MRTCADKKRGQRGNVLVLTTLLLPFLILPLAGLAYDATMCYIVQAELSAAVDGAALGAGRLLGALTDPTSVAKQFVTANFRVGSPGFWGANNLQDTVVYTPGTTKIITINATADVPLVFMRIFRWDHVTVAAAAQASRRDSRVIMVIDRSGSMTNAMIDANGNSSTVIAQVRLYAAAFVKGFIPGVDELGLVIFDGSGVVGYPANYTPGSWTPTVSSTGGPDNLFWDGTSTNGSATGGKGGAPDMVYQIGQITAGWGTGTADALSIAYVELQKAHMRDLAADGKDDRQNSIILFTDGVPSAVSVDLNSPNLPGPFIQPTNISHCVYATDDAARDHPMYAYVVVSGPTYGGPQGDYFQLASMDATASHTATWWMSNPGNIDHGIGYGDAVEPVNETPYSTSTAFGQTNPTCSANLQNFSTNAYKGIPTVDRYGNPTDGSGGPGIANSRFVTVGASPSYTISTATNLVTTNGSSFSGTNPTDPQMWGLATWFAADSAAYKIRTDANYLARGDSARMPITIYAIGYVGSTNMDWGFLQQLANDGASPAHTTTNQQTGKAYLANDYVTLQQAFISIKSAILHLSE